MADTRPTPVGFLRAAHLCLLLVFSPARFIKAEEADRKARNNYIESVPSVNRAYVIRRAFFESLLLVLASGTAGYLGGRLMNSVGRCATPGTVAWLQIVGACILLWGTLFVRGWEVQSHSGVLPSERVNQWLYRFLYCIGTAVVVYSVSFSACKQ